MISIEEFAYIVVVDILYHYLENLRLGMKLVNLSFPNPRLRHVLYMCEFKPKTILCSFWVCVFPLRMISIQYYNVMSNNGKKRPFSESGVIAPRI